MALNIVEEIASDIKCALKSGDTERVGVLRMISASLQNEQLSVNEALSDDRIIAVLRKEAKKRVDAADAFRKGGREERADLEDREKAIIETYLPPELSDDELKQIIQSVMQETGATSVADLGRVMGLTMKRVKGRCDGTKVRSIVEDIFSSSISVV